MIYGHRLTDSGLARVKKKIEERFVNVQSESQIAKEIGLSRNTMRRILRQDRTSATVSKKSIIDLFDKLDLLPLTDADVEFAEDAGNLEEVTDSEEMANPFFWSGPITRPEYFRGRRSEISELRRAHNLTIHYQIIGKPKIGKTSLLEYCRHLAHKWHCRPAYLDGLDKKIHSAKGFCEQIASDLGIEGCKSIDDLYLQIGQISAVQKSEEPSLPVLYLDDFGVFYKGIMTSMGEGEEQDNFWYGLRFSLEQRALVFITTTRQSLGEVLEKHYNREFSEFMTQITSLRLRGFTEPEAQAFVEETQPGGFTFEPKDQELLLAKSRHHDHHPLALQILCRLAYDARVHRMQSIEDAVEAAEMEIKQHLARKDGEHHARGT